MFDTVYRSALLQLLMVVISNHSFSLFSSVEFMNDNFGHSELLKIISLLLLLQTDSFICHKY